MKAPDEDRPNVDYPAAVPYHETAQHYRVNVPRPDTTFMLGQRVPGDGKTRGMGYPGITLRTEAGCFIEVRERSVWHGRESIALQSEGHMDLFGTATVLGATGVPREESDRAKEREPASGVHVRRTLRQDRLYGQLREQMIWMDSMRLAREAISVVRTLVTFPFAWTQTPFKLGALAGNVATLVTSSIQLHQLTPAEVAPEPGLFLTSHQGIFTAADGAQDHFATSGFNFIAGLPKSVDRSPMPGSVNFFASYAFTVQAAVSASIFGTTEASLNSVKSASVVSLIDASLVAKTGTASVLGKHVELGGLHHGPELFRKKKINPLYLRRTHKITLSAKEEIVATVGKKFVVNVPLGEVEVKSRKTVIEGTEVQLKTPAATIRAGLLGATVSHKGGSILSVTAKGANLEAPPFRISVTPAGVMAQGPGGSIQLSPGGIVQIKGTITMIG